MSRPKSCKHCGGLLSQFQTDYCCAACASLYEVTRKNMSDELKTPSKFSRSVEAYSYLDETSSRRRYLQGQDQMTFYVEGLHCAACVNLLENLSTFDEEVLEARVNFGESSLWVRLGPQGRWPRVAATLKELGYDPSPVSPGGNTGAHVQDENRRDLKRIAVAAACAGNTMLFSIPVYAGLDGPWVAIFNFLGFALFLPLVFYSAQPFYRGAWNFLKYRTINVDLPIVVAFLTGFALSSYNLFRGRGPVYFDSTSGFLFLILSSRYLLRRVQQKYQHELQMDQMISPDVKIHDIMTLQAGQKLRVDGTLLSETAEIDMSMFSGESLPQVFQKDMTVFAGTTLLTGPVQIRVNKINAETRVGQLMLLLKSEAIKKAAFVSLSDQLAQGLILLVITLGISYVVLYGQDDFDQALQRSLALIVVACPCALAFGTPLVYGLSLKKARRSGILVKSADVFEKVLKVKTICMDKTGTLTEGILSFRGSTPRELTADEKRLILSLEISSHHPVAFALRRSWIEILDLPVLNNRQEFLGRGVQADFEGHHYYLRSAGATAAGMMTVEFSKDGLVTAQLHFQDELRPDTPSVLKRLNLYRLRILSGDTPGAVRKMAELCDLAPDEWRASLSPEQKWAEVRKQKNTCMIGDGENDALALKSADVGIAVKGSMDLSLAAADVYFLRGGLSPLLDLISIAGQARRTLIRNLAISFAYNGIGGALALGGFINPMVAAILMPISTALLVGSSLWGLR